MGVPKLQQLSYKDGNKSATLEDTSACPAKSDQGKPFLLYAPQTFKQVCGYGEDYMKLHLLEGTLVGSFKTGSFFHEFIQTADLTDEVYEYSEGETIAGGHAIIIVGWGTNSEGIPYWEI